MPLTALQKDVLAILARNRTEESHFAGGIVLNADDRSARFSHDFDIFHEVAEEVTRASNRDVESLRHAGFLVDTPSRYGEWEKESTFRKAKVSRGRDTVEIDWAADSAFRFFPIERDSRLGWRLHLFDIATNKTLALSPGGDLLAACGKNPGFSPLSLLKMMKRFARVDPTKLEEIQARARDPKILKMAWIEMSDEAEAKMIRVADERPDLPIGVAFVDASGKPGWIGDDSSLRLHAPSVRGCWPVVHGLEP